MYTNICKYMFRISFHTFTHVCCCQLPQRNAQYRAIKVKTIPIHVWRDPECSRSLRLRFRNNQHMKAVSLSALRTGSLYPSGNISGTHFRYRLNQPQGHSVAGRIMSIKNSNDIIGNRTCDLPKCKRFCMPNA
jgi:hypothetical protein